MGKIDCIGVGSALVDVLAQVEDSFITSTGGGKGGMVLVDGARMGELLASIDAELREAPGGSAANTAVAMAHLGDQVSLLGKVGNDAGGAFFRSSFERIGGDVSRLKKGDIANGRCLSLITPDSERTMRTDLGASATLAPSEVSAEDFQDCRHAHIEGYLLFNRELMTKVVQSAREAGCTISLDLASYEVVQASKDILTDLLREHVTVAFANEDEARALFGGDDFEAMARQLAELCEIGVVKLGAKGALICKGGEVTRVEPVLVDTVVDATGAGDYWAAGFLHGWLGGEPLDYCGQLGSHLGAAIVQVIGAELHAPAWDALRQQINDIRNSVV